MSERPRTYWSWRDGSVSSGTRCSSCNQQYDRCTAKLVTKSKPCCPTCENVGTHEERRNEKVKRHFKVDPKDMLPDDKIVKIEVTVERDAPKYIPGRVYSIVKLGSNPFNAWYTEHKGNACFMDAEGLDITPDEVDSATEVEFKN